MLQEVKPERDRWPWGLGRTHKHELEMTRNNPCPCLAYPWGPGKGVWLCLRLGVPNPEKGVRMVGQWMGWGTAPFRMGWQLGESEVK